MRIWAPIRWSAARAWKRLEDTYLRARGLYGATDVDELPKTLAQRRLYVVGENGQSWFAAFVCPCGCGAIIHASFVEGSRPRWRLVRHFGGAVSLHPSVSRTKGCQSHFWLRRGRVEWCRPSLGAERLLG
jgi:hypothetical protein